jgi:hypothetical protein
VDQLAAGHVQHPLDDPPGMAPADDHRGLLPTGRVYCLSHDPEMAPKIEEARPRGGTTTMRLRGLEGRWQRLDTAPKLVRFVSDSMLDLLSGTVLPEIGRAVIYAARLQRQLLESSDLHKRVEALEDQLARGPSVRARLWD